MSRILITGGAGFVGYHLSEYLSRRGDEVVIADNLFRGKRDADLVSLLARPNVRLIETDLTEKENWKELGGGYDHVYHLVSVNGTRLFYEIPHVVLRVGVLSAIYALEWFRDVNQKKGAKILYTSSNEAYGGALEAFGVLPIPTPEEVPLVIPDPYNPRWSYGGQKLVGELLFIYFAKAYGLRMSIVRPHNFYGPRAGFDHVIPSVLEKIKEKKDPFPIPGAEQTRAFCYIDDAVDALARVMESEVTDGKTYHIGTSVETVIGDLVDTMFALSNWRPKERDTNVPPEGSVKRRAPDVSKIQRDIGWEPTTPLEDGLKKTIEWYLANPSSSKK